MTTVAPRLYKTGDRVLWKDREAAIIHTDSHSDCRLTNTRKQSWWCLPNDPFLNLISRKKFKCSMSNKEMTTVDAYFVPGKWYEYHNPYNQHGWMQMISSTNTSLAKNITRIPHGSLLMFVECQLFVENNCLYFVKAGFQDVFGWIILSVLSSNDITRITKMLKRVDGF